MKHWHNYQYFTLVYILGKSTIKKHISSSSECFMWWQRNSGMKMMMILPTFLLAKCHTEQSNMSPHLVIPAVLRLRSQSSPSLTGQEEVKAVRPALATQTHILQGALQSLLRFLEHDIAYTRALQLSKLP